MNALLRVIFWCIFVFCFLFVFRFFQNKFQYLANWTSTTNWHLTNFLCFNCLQFCIPPPPLSLRLLVVSHLFVGLIDARYFACNQTEIIEATRKKNTRKLFRNEKEHTTHKGDKKNSNKRTSQSTSGTRQKKIEKERKKTCVTLSCLSLCCL